LICPEPKDPAWRHEPKTFTYRYSQVNDEREKCQEKEALDGNGVMLKDMVVTTEMGGAGQCSPSVLRITEKGVRNVMIHFKLIEGKLDPPQSDVTVVASTQREDYHLSPANGIYESFYEVGEGVKKGDPLGQVHFPERHDYVPEVLTAASSGILITRRFPGGTHRGDCVAVVARPFEAG